MQKIQKRYTLLIVPILLFLDFSLSLNCSKKYPFVEFISPNDKKTEYFLDKDTFQVISYGYALNTFEIQEKYSNNIYFPLDINKNFNIDDIIQYNKRIATQKNNKEKLKIINNSITLEKMIEQKLKVLHKDLESQLNDKEKKKKEKSLLIFEDKKSKVILNRLEELACKQAENLALYRWAVLSEKNSQNKNTIIEIDPIQNIIFDFLKTRYYKEDESTISLSNYDKSIFPVKRYYENENKYKKQQKVFRKNFNNKDIKYELIQNSFDNYNQLRCKAIIHIKKEDLILKYPHLLKKSSSNL